MNEKERALTLPDFTKQNVAWNRPNGKGIDVTTLPATGRRGLKNKEPGNSTELFQK